MFYKNTPNDKQGKKNKQIKKSRKPKIHKEIVMRLQDLVDNPT